MSLVAAVTTSQPSALAPGLPSVAESLPGYESVQMYGLFAPAGTPESIIKRLNQESVRFLSTVKTREQFLAAGVETSGSTTQVFASAVKSEVTRMGKVISDAGIRLE